MWFRFVLASLVIFFAGRYLSDLADETADITGLSKGFIGALILGIITSLPELIGTISAVAYKSNPDLGVGNIFGSNLFNIAILSLAIVLFGSRVAGNGWKWRSNFSAYLSISLSAFLVMLIGMCSFSQKSCALWGDIFILAFYLLGMWIYSRQGFEEQDLQAVHERKPGRSLKVNIILICVSGVLVVGAGVLLADACDDIARNTYLTSTFVGSLFMAAATSLPELVVTMRLLGLGNISMATGNIFGSNLMNLTIIAFADLMYAKSVYAAVTPAQTVTLGAGILMSGIFLAGTLVRAKRKAPFRMDSIGVLVLYLLIYVWLYNH
ncbi:MAG TPA: sodium:calcium antiporter [Deltaproteobacteria bacterium]|nr:sodium:calcium antiporter [Deltaproteobacteria bacterium]